MSPMATINQPPSAEKSDKKPRQNKPEESLAARIRNYFQGVRSEWGKISWPTWPQVWGQIIVVLVMVSIMTLGLFIMDSSFSFIVKWITPARF